MNIVLYTTSNNSWYQEEADKVAAIYGQKIPGFTITLQKISAPKKLPLIIDNDGDKRPVWDYLTLNFTKGDFDGVGIHFTQYYKDKWGISKHINGTRHSQNKEYPFFWMCADKGQMAPGYEDLSQFARILIHELAHFFEDLDDAFGDKLNQNSVHLVDYDLKKIHLYPFLLDYRGYIIKLKVNKLVNQVITFVRKAL